LPLPLGPARPRPGRRRQRPRRVLGGAERADHGEQGPDVPGREGAPAAGADGAGADGRARLGSCSERAAVSAAAGPGVTGFFTGSTLCIGCKACEVACKEWNEIPADGFVWSGLSYDNTLALGHSSWRHVQFVERLPTVGQGGFASPDVAWEFS